LRTSKPFSTISYNSPEFLTEKLNDLVQRRVVSFFAFVKHYKEDDEKKDHIHLIVFPNGQYQTDALHDYLLEPDITDLTKKPLGIMPCVNSKFGDWYLYTSHDAAYLASKGQTRKYHYLEEDFVSSDSDFLHELIRTIDRTKYAKTQDFVDQVKNGVSFKDMVVKGQIPAPQFNQWRAMYEYLMFGNTFRNDRETHSPKVDPETGEVIEADQISRTPIEDEEEIKFINEIFK
jgi:hypothetical protein